MVAVDPRLLPIEVVRNDDPHASVLSVALSPLCQPRTYPVIVYAQIEQQKMEEHGKRCFIGSRDTTEFPE